MESAESYSCRSVNSMAVRISRSKRGSENSRSGVAVRLTADKRKIQSVFIVQIIAHRDKQSVRSGFDLSLRDEQLSILKVIFRQSPLAVDCRGNITIRINPRTGVGDEKAKLFHADRIAGPAGSIEPDGGREGVPHEQ